MPVMVEKRKPGRPPKGDKPQPRDTSRHVSPRLAFHLPPSLLKAFMSYLDELDPRPDQSEALRSALKEFLKARGKWPPPA
jgi:hypothetical protein